MNHHPDLVYDADGVLVGWYCLTWISATRRSSVFIPRRDEDIAADRARAVR